MKFAVFVGRLAGVLLCVAIATAASARELRHPARAVPAFTVQVPDDWTYSVGTDNALVAVSQDRSTSIVLSFGADSGSLEDVTRVMFLAAGVATPADKTPASISGLAGFSCESANAATAPRPCCSTPAIRPSNGNSPKASCGAFRSLARGDDPKRPYFRLSNGGRLSSGVISGPENVK
jgi:hypothetical protein